MGCSSYSKEVKIGCCKATERKFYFDKDFQNIYDENKNLLGEIHSIDDDRTSDIIQLTYKKPGDITEFFVHVSRYLLNYLL